ncbi:hypothetical protein [Frondihabitans cladoniiphilus]|uniref:Dolichyl-phosphate-mannose-protein mannosyltransferase n=1 Tax=Frondihabitans cladoniiphilus TaxID=715785 RepID=A0ABP8W1R5_9MICO
MQLHRTVSPRSSAGSDTLLAPPAGHSRIRSVALELGGGAAALVLGLAALAHVVLSARSVVFFTNGDSVLMPLIERSLREGQPFDWALSSVLFFVPEIPVYAAVSLFFPDPHAAMLVNALVIVVALYALLRGLVAVVARHAGRLTRILVALVPVAILLGGTLLEHDPGRDGLELVSLFLTTSYYYGTTLAMVASFALVIASVAGRSARSRRAALVGLGIVTALAVLSNPLILLWAVAPSILTLALLLRRRSFPLRAALVPTAVLVAATLVGYLLRVPFRAHIARSMGAYFHLGAWHRSAQTFIDEFFGTAAGWQGSIEMTLLAVALAGTFALAIVALVRRWPTRIALGLVIPAVSILVTVAGSVVLGETATRYLMPLFFAPACSAVVLLVHALERFPERSGVALPRDGASAPMGRRILAVALIAGAVIGVASVRVTTTAPSTQAYAPATCLSNWIGGRDLTGAGEFWTIRALQAYGDSSVKLLQIGSGYGAHVWLENAADDRGQDISYLVTDDRSVYGTSPLQKLGAPAQTITCGQYTILDYQGTPGELRLSQHVAATAAAVIARDGLVSSRKPLPN